MMRRIIENSYRHTLKNVKILLLGDHSHVACSQGKLIIKPPPSKIVNEISDFLEKIQGDICEPIH